MAERTGKHHVTAATKSNGIYHSMPYWDEPFRSVAEFPTVHIDQEHIDILYAKFVQQPERCDVVVASNLFGNILADLGPSVTGTIGVVPAANLNPEGMFPSTFEPVHGSAPDIAGTGVANPVGQIWSAAMMLNQLGHPEADADLVRAIETTLGEASAPRTPDLGGRASTAELGAAITAAIG